MKRGAPHTRNPTSPPRLTKAPRFWPPRYGMRSQPTAGSPDSSPMPPPSSPASSRTTRIVADKSASSSASRGIRSRKAPASDSGNGAPADRPRASSIIGISRFHHVPNRIPRFVWPDPARHVGGPSFRRPDEPLRVPAVLLLVCDFRVRLHRLRNRSRRQNLEGPGQPPAMAVRHSSRRHLDSLLVREFTLAARSRSIQNLDRYPLPDRGKRRLNPIESAVIPHIEQPVNIGLRNSHASRQLRFGNAGPPERQIKLRLCRRHRGKLDRVELPAFMPARNRQVPAGLDIVRDHHQQRVHRHLGGIFPGISLRDSPFKIRKGNDEAASFRIRFELRAVLHAVSYTHLRAHETGRNL